MTALFKHVTVRINYSNEASLLLNICWQLHVLSCLCFLWFWFESFACELISDIFNVALHEETFLKISSKFCFLEMV